MRAAILSGREAVSVESREVPEVGPDEVLIRVSFCGVCGTDMSEFRNGPILAHVADEPHPVTGHRGPVVLGHEFAGYVVERGPNVALELGALVACAGCVVCGHCEQCRAGRSNLCSSYHVLGLHRDGGLAEYCAAPASSCVAVERFGLSPHAASLAQPMAIAVHALGRGGLGAGDSVAVVGAGGVGAFLLYAAAASGVRATAVDLAEDRLALAKTLGASACGRPEEILANSPGSFVAVFEVSGTSSGLRTALTLAAPGGRVVLVGLQSRDSGVPLLDVTLRELTLLGAMSMVTGVDMPEALRVLATRREGWHDVVPDAFNLEDLVRESLDPSTATDRIKTLFAPALTTRMDTSAAERMPRAG